MFKPARNTLLALITSVVATPDDAIVAAHAAGLYPRLGQADHCLCYDSGMEADKNIAKEAEKSTYRLKSDIDTPQEELRDLRQSTKRENALLLVAALFIIVLGAILWWALAQH